MRVVFRTEGNHEQGMGDLWGSIALADECAKREDDVLLVFSGGDEARAIVRTRGYRFQTPSSFQEEQLAIAAFQPDVIVVNQLSTSAERIQAFKTMARLVVTLDDTGEGAQLADLRVNVLYETPGSVTEPGYVVLRREFQRAHEGVKPVRETVEELVVTQGGGDTHGFTPWIIRALEHMSLRPHCTVIVGPAFRHHDQLERAVQTSTLRLSIAHDPTNLVELMRDADLAITAGGLMMFELACVGTPGIVVCAEPFELETARRLEQAGAVRCAGFGGSIDYAQLPRAVEELAANRTLREAMSACGKQLVDGQGCQRIMRLIRKELMSSVGGRV